MYKIYEAMRTERGLTDYAVSKKTGIAQSTFTRWKKGVSNPNSDKIRKIAALFGVPMETFFEEVSA